MANRLYVGTDEGLFVLAQHEGLWGVESHALTDFGVEEIAVQPNGRVLAGTRGDGVWASDDAGKTWKKPSYGRPGPGKVRCLTIDPKDPNHIFAGGEPIEVFETDDGGANWRSIQSIRDLPFVGGISYPVKTVEPHVRDITLDPLHPGTMYVALQVGYMIKTTDGGKTWKRMDQEVDPDIHTIIVNPTHPETVIVATGGGGIRAMGVPVADYKPENEPGKGRAMYVSQDGGQHFSPIGMEFEQHYSVPLVQHPTDPSILYAGLADGAPPSWRRPEGARGALVSSGDGGKTWKRIDQSIPFGGMLFPGAINLDASDASQMFVGLASRGGASRVATSDTAGQSWTAVEAEFPEISDLKCATV